MRIRQAELTGFGDHLRVATSVATPERLSEALSIAAEHVVARGGGNSYGDIAIAAEGITVDMTHMTRVLEWAPDFSTIRAEAGVQVGVLLRYLNQRGRTLAVAPGAPTATLGGCVAMDVHGKNAHSRGSFGDHVVSLDLIGRTGLQRLSPECDEQAFITTIGGMGSTGIIYAVELRTLPSPTGAIQVAHEQTNCLQASLDRLTERCATHEFVYAWIDPMASGRSRGRGVVWYADHLPVASHEAMGAGEETSVGGSLRTVPVPRIGIGASQLAASAVTQLAWRASRRNQHVAILQDEYSFHFPFARAPAWANAYGRGGFYERQYWFPESAAGEGIEHILSLREEHRSPAMFGSLKRFTTTSRGPLGFVRPGISLALQLPRKGLDPELISKMNRVVEERGGGEYLAKTQEEPTNMLMNIGGDGRHLPVTFPTEYASANAFFARNAGKANLAR